MANEKRLIDANALIHRVVAERDSVEIKTGCDIGYHNGLNMAVSMAINAPTVDAVEVVHGRWAALDDDCEELEGEEEAMRWGCTACREIVEYSDWTHKRLLTRYCPNCGAKMRGSE